MAMKLKKIVIIGCGAVGTSILYAATNRGIAAEYILIDAFENVAKGNQIDVDDMRATAPANFKIKAGNYDDCKDADIIVITAGKPQANKDQSRLELLTINAKIMHEIGTNVRKSGFNGITIVVSNPCDILATVYQKTTGFDEHKVLSSGTLLDSSRLRRILASELKANIADTKAYIFGEHGDSEVFATSYTTVNNYPLSKFVADKKITAAKLDEIETKTKNVAYEIISLKRATFYGIGSCVAFLMQQIINDANEIAVFGIKFSGQYGFKDVYASLPAHIGANGWCCVLEPEISAAEKEKLHKSVDVLTQNYNHVIKQLESDGFKFAS